MKNNIKEYQTITLRASNTIIAFITCQKETFLHVNLYTPNNFHSNFSVLTVTKKEKKNGHLGGCRYLLLCSIVQAYAGPGQR